MKAAEEIRLFAGLELSPEARRYACGMAAHLESRLPGVRWVPRGNLHVTVKFFGDCPAGIVPDLVGLMEETTPMFPLELEIGGIGGFPSQGSARVVWVGALDRSSRLTEVHGTIDRGARGMGIRRDGRRYAPHITIGRARKTPVSLPAGEAPGEEGRVVMAAGGLVLYRSVLTGSGAEYSIIERTGV